MQNTDTRTFAQTAQSVRYSDNGASQRPKHPLQRPLGILLCLSLHLSAALHTGSASAETVSSGSLILHHNGKQTEALQLDASMALNVQGLLAELTLTQRFQNTTAEWVDANYLYPMSEDAAVQGLSIRIGEREIIGRIKARQKARETFNAAKQAGQIASLVEQQRPNLFSTEVASIAPGEFVDVTLAVMVPVKVTDNQMEVTLPTTLTPRYSGEHAIDAAAIDSPFVMPSQSRGPRLSLNAQITPLDNYATVSSQSHEIHLSETGVQMNDIPMDRDLTLRWPLPQSEMTSSYAFTSEHEGRRYVQLMINPPIQEQTAAQAQIQRELILIVDKSGSMAGVSMDAAKEALHFALDQLTEDDYFNIIAFDNNEHALFNHSRPANAEWITMARRFTTRLQADGGTEMEAALRTAMQSDNGANGRGDGDEDGTVNTGNERLKQIVFLTDGSVGYEEELLTMIKRQLGNSRLFTIGIGHAPNTWFLEKAAEAGRGIALNIQDEHDVAQSVTELLSSLSRPVITDIAVQYSQGHGELYPKPVPDLYANKPGMWVSRISKDVEEIVVTGKQYGQRWKRVIHLDSQAAEPVAQAGPLEQQQSDTSNKAQSSLQHAPAVAMHWTRQKVESLLDEQRYSADKDRHENIITQLALGVGLLTPYTSFVAVEETPIRPSHQNAVNVDVANLIPAGNSMMVAMPQGAAGVDTLAWLSLLLAASGLGLTRFGARGLQREH